MIYLFTEYDKITDDLIPALLERLPEKRRKQALRFRYMGGRISCIVGYLLFLYGYKHLHNRIDHPDFTKDRNGKPYLADDSDIFFNISHCNGAAACIFGDSPVGIDIQDIRELKMRHVMRVCSPEEQNRIKSALEPDLEFCRIWSIKESVSKLTGKGVFRDIKNLNEKGTHTGTFFIQPNKYMTAASSDVNAEFSIHILSLKNLLEL